MMTDQQKKTETPSGPPFTREIINRIIDGFLGDREAMLQELEDAGFDREDVVKHARTLGLNKEFLQQHKINPRELSVRTCIGCDREFLSQGSHNRFCDPCRPRN